MTVRYYILDDKGKPYWDKGQDQYATAIARNVKQVYFYPALKSALITFKKRSALTIAIDNLIAVNPR